MRRRIVSRFCSNKLRNSLRNSVPSTCSPCRYHPIGSRDRQRRAHLRIVTNRSFVLLSPVISRSLRGIRGPRYHRDPGSAARAQLPRRSMASP
jgi:hypothetical protein